MTMWNGTLKDSKRKWYLYQKRKRAIERKKAARKLRQTQRSWTAGKLITFVSIDIFGHEHRFLCRMKKCYKDLEAHRCAQCKIINHYRPCMDLRGVMRIKCMRKSDLSCYPYILKKL